MARKAAVPGVHSQLKCQCLHRTVFFIQWLPPQHAMQLHCIGGSCLSKFLVHGKSLDGSHASPFSNCLHLDAPMQAS
eukprot:10149492-Lingulodinium_polyedra.AAC.1